MGRILGRMMILLTAGAFFFGCSKQEPTQEKAGSAAPELQVLDWLVGNWEDAEESLDVTFSWKWDLNHHFLIQQFRMNEEDETPLSGTQILGWDPLAKTLRSWTYDSDGGFGESRWTKNDGNWYVEASYVTAEGQKASATYVYTKLDDNSINFSSGARQVDGDILPDAGPYKFVRKN